MPPQDLDTSDRPLVFVWEVTQACELTCKHCRADAQPECHPNELTTREGKALLEDVRDFDDYQLVVLSGGDPLARDDTVELVEYGVDLGLQMTITPSGTSSLRAEAIDALAEAGIRRVALSIDGATADTHDGFRGEAGSFEETLRAARAINRADVPLQINTTVCAETVDELPAIRRLVAELDGVLWSVFFLVPVGRGRTLSEIAPSRAEGVMHWLAEVAAVEDFAVKSTEAPFYRRVLAERAASLDNDHPSIEAPASRGPGIIAGDGFAFVSHLGEIYPSGFLPQSVGNVREHHVADLYRHSELFRALRNRSLLTGKCGACPYRHVCGGSRSRAYACTGDPHASDPLCPFVPENYDGPFPSSIASSGSP